MEKRSTVKCSSEFVVDLTEKKPVRVLHVDDEAGFLKAAKRCLEMQGAFQVETALSVEEAMAKLKEKPFDAVVADYVMPKKDGLEFLRELRAKGNRIPFIIFTGKGREEVAIKALNLGADQYFNKIGDPETVYCELAHGIRRAVEGKKAEEALKESEEKYRSIVELAPDAIITLDPEGVITSCNTATTRRMGYSRDELVGKHFSEMDFLRAKDYPKHHKLFSSILRGKAPKPFEVTWHHKDGTPFHAEVHVTLMKKGDKTIGVQAIARDITERKKTEETLKESEQRYRQLFEGISDAVMVYSSDGKFLDCNEVTLRRLGYSREEFLRLTAADIVHPDFHRLMKDNQKRIWAGENTIVESAHRCKDGSVIPVEVNAHRIEYEGKPAILAVVRDITERKEAEGVLRESEERYSRLVELSPDTIAVHSEGKIVFINTAGAKLLQAANPEQLIGKPIMDFLQPSYREIVKERIRQIREEGKEVPLIEEKFIRLDGTEVDVEVAAIPLTYDGKPATLAIARDITRRKRAEEALNERQNLIQKIGETIPALVYIYDLIEQRNVYTNDKLPEILGYTAEEFQKMGSNLIENLVHPNDLKSTIEHMKKLARAKDDEILENEYRMRHADGEWHWLKSRDCVFTRAPDGSPKQNLGIAIDITERKKSEKMMQEASEEWKKTFDAISDFVFVLDKDFRFVRVNKALCDVLKKGSKGLIGKRCFEVMHGTNKPWPNCPYEKTLVTKKATTGEINDPYLGLPLLISNSPIFDDESELIGCVHVAKDISERKRTEETARRQADLLQKTFNSLTDAIFILDAEVPPRIRECNEAASVIFGYGKAEMLGKTTAFLHVSDESLKKFQSLLYPVAAKGQLYFHLPEHQMRRKDGSIFSSEHSVAQLLNDKGERVGWVSLVRDITKRKQIEGDLKETVEELKTMNEKLGVVGKLTRHDIRNKLFVITNNIYLAKQRLTNDPETLEYLREIESACGLVERILDYARDYERLGIEELAYLDAEESFERAAMEFQDIHGIKIVNDCHGLTVLADSLLGALFYNLIHNSLKHGEKVSRIRAYYKVEKDKLRLVYEDDGVGIPETGKEKIFTEGCRKGTGYGLYLIRKICEVYGWNIQETGKPGKGAQFNITIPKTNKSGKTNYRLNQCAQATHLEHQTISG